MMGCKRSLDQNGSSAGKANGKPIKQDGLLKNAKANGSSVQGQNSRPGNGYNGVKTKANTLGCGPGPTPSNEQQYWHGLVSNG
ncbi:hypothetical protein M0R45_027331 [Rubus argutus]|uniref:Uncharacterized protein n=1 Tax=Rubus argutus TaxID=59490 RepID=A0AAW1X1W3_RUBAR